MNATHPHETVLLKRIEELEMLLEAQQLEVRSQSVIARIKRLEADLKTLRAARENAEFRIVDLQASLKRAEESAEEIRQTKAYRLGALLLDGFRNWDGFVKLVPTYLAWRRDNLRQAKERAGLLVPEATAPDYVRASEAAIEKSDREGAAAAEQWLVDQRLRAPILARALTDLAVHVRKSDPAKAVAIAKAALDADPHESRVKRLAFIMMDMGSVSEAADVLRSAVAAGASLNAAEARRAEELFLLTSLHSHGLTLLSDRRKAKPAGPKRILLFVPQSLPNHWSATTMRTHATAQTIRKAGIGIDVVTVPGYPDPNKAVGAGQPATQTIDNIAYHRLAAIEQTAAFSEDYARLTGLALGRLIRERKSTILIAPLEFTLAYPAAIASQITGVDLVLDCPSVACDLPEAATERDALLFELEQKLAARAPVVLARSPHIREALVRRAVPGQVVDVPEAAPEFPPHATPLWRENPALADRTVIGYVGDPADDLDLEALPDILDGLVKAGLNVGLAIFCVGTRAQRIGARIELLGHGGRAVLGGRPATGAIIRAFEAIDIFVAPAKVPAAQRLRSYYELANALTHGKCVVTSSTPDRAEMLGEHAVYVDGGTAEFVSVLTGLIKEPKEWQRIAAAGQEWANTGLSGKPLVEALSAL